ncbi:MAG TPA: CoA pyrophosphatase, partial [Kineosporiaceae bacterium]|nr:CoA pyrophosphatase [Kineosporiaceae bacterium]
MRDDRPGSPTRWVTPAAPRPAWFEDLVAGTHSAQADELSRFTPPPGHLRRSAVLMLFGSSADHGSADHGSAPYRSADHGSAPHRSADRAGAVRSSDAGPDVLLTVRASTLRSHAGQVAFPGGAIDVTDAGPAAAALREAHEETGLDPDGVQVAGHLPDLFLPVSDFAVTPVLAWWRRPSPVRVVDRAEVARVVRVPVAELLDPANRFRAVHPSGFTGPAFRAQGLFVWGFTAGLLDRVFHLSGWERPWDRERLED